MILVPLTINHSSLGYGGGGGWNTLDPRVCGDKLCSEIPGGRSAWEAKNEPIEQENKKNSLQLPPRQQVKNGIVPADVTCRESLKLIFKVIDNSPACVKYETTVKLEDRGWGVMPPPCCKPTEVSSIESFDECIAAGNPVMESHPRQCRTPDGKQFVESIQEIETTEFEKNDFAIPSHDCSGSASCFTGSVTQIIDGDTIKVDGKSIRFALTSTPELNKSGGQEARAFIENICPVGSLALVDEDDGQTQGSYGRIIAVIYCNDMNLNEEILDAGLGDLSTGFCSVSEFSIHPWAKKYGC